MKDIQNQEDHRRINIKKVGVKTISYPITVLDKARSKQHTLATVNMYVNLPHHFKGTHMSRFVEILNRFHGAIDISNFHYILEEMKEKLEAEAAHIEMAFAYFLPAKENPETLKSSRYECCMHGSLEKDNELEFQVIVPISLPLVEKTGQGLPRSLGHWGQAVVAVKFRNFLWIEDLIILIKEAINVEQHSVPTQGGKNSLSVESLIRRIAKSLKEEETIRWFSVRVENLAEGYSTFAAMDSSS